VVSGGLHAEAGEHFVRALDLAADVRQPAVFLVPRHVVRIDRHDDAAQAVIGEAAHVLLGPEGAVGADQRPNAPLGRVADHRAEILVRQRFSADEKHIANMVFDRDVDHIARLFQSDRTPVARLEFVDRESAKIAAGVADIGDGELQKSGAAVIKHFAQQAPDGFFRFHDRDGDLCGGGVRGLPRHGLFFGRLIVGKHGLLIATIRPQVNPGFTAVHHWRSRSWHKPPEADELWSGSMCA
jgi:hypothetical protein